MKRSLLVIAAIAAIAGCTTPPEHKVGAVSGGQFHTIPASYDPSVSGWPAAVGDIVQNAGSLQAWVRFGSNDTDWRTFPSAGVPGSSLAVGTWRTPVIDLTATGTTSFNMPVIAGNSFHAIGQMRLELLTCDAALTTGLTWSIDQNGGDLSPMTGMTLATGTINAFPAPATFGVSPLTINIVSMASYPLQIKITVGVAGSGLTSCTGRFIATGFYSTS
jgi:hypothetical protein